MLFINASAQTVFLLDLHSFKVCLSLFHTSTNSRTNHVGHLFLEMHLLCNFLNPLHFLVFEHKPYLIEPPKEKIHRSQVR